MDELFGNFDLSFVQTVVVGGVALCLRDGDHHVLLLLPEHLLGGDCSLQVVLLKHTHTQVNVISAPFTYENRSVHF